MMDVFISQAHFLRPMWFFAFIPLLLLCFFILKNRLFSHSWQSIIAPELLPHLLVGKQTTKTALPAIVFFVVGSLVIVSLAGPVWEKRPQPVFKEKSALVIALDLSRSMDANDIKPSRLSRARYKISDILKHRVEGQTALIAYAADAFVVTPLTDDTLTIDSLLSSLTTDLMPAQGTRTDKAIEKAASLLKNAGIKKGDILLVTDGIESSATDKFKQVAKQHRISILAIATTEGAPIPMPNGGFVKDNSGAIVLPKLNIGALNKFSQLGHGRLSIISSDDSDILNITSQLKVNRFQAKTGQQQNQPTDSLTADSWYEQGPWLLLLVIPFAALVFRRGLLFVIPIIFLLQHPQTAEASTDTGLWDTLWNNSDQRAMKLYKQDPATAAELFNDKQWKAAALYKSRQYQKSIDTLKEVNTADAYYNKGNAYAKLEQTEQAIKEYEKALKLNPEHKDARYNKKLLERKKSSDKKNKSNQNKKGTPSKQGNKNQPSKDGNNSDRKKSDNKQNSEKPDNTSKDNNATNKEQTGKKQKPSDNNKNTQQGEQNKEMPNKLKSKKLNSKDAQSRQATEQWLRRIPDDPGGLLRNKFLYQYKRQQHSNEDNAW